MDGRPRVVYHAAMPAFLNWLLRLLPTNPICMRLVQGGSRRTRHLYIRIGYLTALMVVVFFSLLGSTEITFSQLASRGARAFWLISYLQIGLICLLTPVFMAGAIAQEANPRTWDILLTTPMNNLQIVLGNMFGRLFFVLALLFSTLPLFVTIQYFGGVPGEAIFLSYAIAGCSALLVAAIAVTLSVTRTAGRRAVFVFYITVVLYLFATYALDRMIRQPLGGATQVFQTTWLTPLNPFLAMEVLLASNRYVPADFTGIDALWLTKTWKGRPIATFCWLCVLISTALVVISTVRVRVIGAKVGAVPWYRKALGLGARGAQERPPRTVGHNPIAWRESVARGGTLSAILARWGFAALGVTIALVIFTLYHVGRLSHAQLQASLATVVGAEIVIIVLTALNQSATAVSREREDGSLDILLTTPIQPGPYLAGKLRGLIQYLMPMLVVPLATLGVGSLYVLGEGLQREGGITVRAQLAGAASIELPVLLPEGVLAMAMTLVPFTAFCVMVGLQWSIRSRGTIGSVIAAVGIVLAVAGTIGLCGIFSGQQMGIVGAVVNAFNPINLLIAIVHPEAMMPDALEAGGLSEVNGARVVLLVGSAIAGAAFLALVYGMHQNMKRTFHMTVRKLAGQR